jgi:hypothetical protein
MKNECIDTIIQRYFMATGRLSLQVFYLWRHVSSTAPPLILWWSTSEILVGPLHSSSPFIGELRCQGIQTGHGPYITERTQKAVYIVRCLCNYQSFVAQVFIQMYPWSGLRSEFKTNAELILCLATKKPQHNLKSTLPGYL